MNFKFNVGDSVQIKENFIDLWAENRTRLPMDHILEHFKSMVGSEWIIKDRIAYNGDNLYNIDGFGFEEYVLEPFVNQ